MHTSYFHLADSYKEKLLTRADIPQTANSRDGI